MATKLGISGVHINKLLNGAVTPSLLLAFRLAKELDSTVTDLWGLTEPNELTEVEVVARTDQTRNRR